MPWQLLAMLWQIDSTPPGLGGGSLKKHLLSSYYMAGSRLDDKATKTIKNKYLSLKICTLVMNEAGVHANNKNTQRRGGVQP